METEYINLAFFKKPCLLIDKKTQNKLYFQESACVFNTGKSRNSRELSAASISSF